MHKRAVIIGGGISGLSAAFFLSERIARENLSLKITVLEAENRFGGLLRTLRTRDFHMEAGADAFDGRDPAMLALCRDLGLRDELVPCEPTLDRVFLAQNEKLLSLSLSRPDLRAVFKNPALNLTARMRLLFEGLIPAKRNGADESIASFVRRRLGRTVLQAWAEPLVRGVLMGEAEKLSIHEYFPQWQRMERDHGSICRALLNRNMPAKEAPSFFTVRGGLDRLASAFLEKLERANLVSSSRAVSLGRNKTWKVFLRDGRTIEADFVWVALPAPEAARLLTAAAPPLAGALAKIRYDSLAAVNMVFRRGALPADFPQNGFILPPRGKKRPFANLKVIGSTEDGKFIRLRAFLSKVFQPELLGLEDARIRQEVLRDLVAEWRVQPPFWIAVERYPEALAQYETGHGRLVSNIESLLEPYPGLFLAGNGYHGFGISDCILSAKAAVQGIKLF